MRSCISTIITPNSIEPLLWTTEHILPNSFVYLENRHQTSESEFGFIAKNIFDRWLHGHSCAPPTSVYMLFYVLFILSILLFFYTFYWTKPLPCRCLVPSLFYHLFMPMYCQLIWRYLQISISSYSHPFGMALMLWDHSKYNQPKPNPSQAKPKPIN